MGQIEGCPVTEITCTDCREAKNVFGDIDKEYITMGHTGTFSKLYAMQGYWTIYGNYIVKTKTV